jgi:hypothetical protein
VLCSPDEETLVDRFREPQGVAVVLLSKGLPADPIAMGAVVVVRRAMLGFVSVLSQEAFWKPDAEFLDALRGGAGAIGAAELPEVQRLAPDASFQDIAESLMPLYTQIAVGFSPELNEKLMMEEFSTIERRASCQTTGGIASTRSVINAPSTNSGETPKVSAYQADLSPMEEQAPPAQAGHHIAAAKEVQAGAPLSARSVPEPPEIKAASDFLPMDDEASLCDEPHVRAI